MLPEQSIEFRYDTQLLIDGYEDLDEDEVFDYIAENFKGDSLLAVGGDGDPIKIHYHTKSPGWCWPTAGLWVRSTTSSWKIWTVRQEACRGNRVYPPRIIRGTSHNRKRCENNWSLSQKKPHVM